MKAAFSVCGLLLAYAAQAQEPVVRKEEHSVHRVERGNMLLRQDASGEVTALKPPTAIVEVTVGDGERCEVGRMALVQFAPPEVIPGKVTRAISSGNGRIGCEIEFSKPLPDHIAVGNSIRVLIEVGEMRDVVFFDRPSDSSENSEAAVFVVEPGDNSARRVTVHYGRISGPQIQIIDGLAPGDRVIVTDMSKWASFERVRLQ
jgi:HlyD family secretion protein